MAEEIELPFGDDSAAPVPNATQPGVDADDFLASLDIQPEGSRNDLSRPWMKFHKFHLVKTVKEVRELVDAILAHGNCSLDLETEGFDNRIEYDARGNLHTRHKIVGYCLGFKAEGYYIPVRHRWEKAYDPKGPNVDDVVGTDLEIKRLCRASQPEIDPEVAKYDPLGGKPLHPPKVIIKFWHSKFDQEYLYPITGIDWWHPDSFEDGMLAAYVLYTDGDHGLKENALEKIPPKVDPKTGEKYPYEMIKLRDLFPRGMKKNDTRFYNLSPSLEGDGWNTVLYGGSDGICTDILCDLLVPKASETKYGGWYRLEKQVVQAVRILERTRVKVDKEEIRKLLKEAEDEFASYEERIVRMAEAMGFKGFNPGSSSQLAEFLFEPKGLNLNPKPEKTDNGQYKTNADTLETLLEEIENPPEVIDWILKHRQISKIKGTYLESLANNTDEKDQLRLNFKQTGAATGRFTAPKGDADHGFAGVPIQGIPAKNDPKKPKVAHSLRRVFVARPGYVIAKVDYASQELRIASSVSGERKWINEYVKEQETGVTADLHAMTAEAFYPGLKKSDPDYKLKRGQGKTANFALVYGGGVGAVRRATGCDDVEGARLLKAFHESVPNFSKWVAGQHEIVKGQLGVRTAFGRFIAIPDAMLTGDQIIAGHAQREERKRLKAEAEGKKYEPLPPPDKKRAWREAKGIRAACERKSTNFPIQGSGADILKIALVMLIKEFTLRGWLKDGDDSVRLVMVVHDEIVFEVREDLVGVAVPIIKKIMEYPSVLKNWTVPLIAEPDLGYSWNANIHWMDMMRGEVEPPPYLQGQAIDTDPPLLILSRPKKEGEEGPVVAPRPQVTLGPRTEAPEEVAPEPEVQPAAEVAVEVEESPASKVEASPSSDTIICPGFTCKTFAVYKIGKYYADARVLDIVVLSLIMAQEQTSIQGLTDEMVPVQIENCFGDVLLGYKEGIMARPEALSKELRLRGLSPGAFEVRDAY